MLTRLKKILCRHKRKGVYYDWYDFGKVYRGEKVKHYTRCEKCGNMKIIKTK